MLNDIRFVVNFHKEDVADIMVDQEIATEEGQKLPSDDEVLLNAMTELNISLDSLNGSTAIIRKRYKQLEILLKGVSDYIRISPLEFLPIDEYRALVDAVNESKSVILSEIEPQFGGVIDRNYGVSFKIKEVL